MNSRRALVATLATALSAALLATFATAASARTLYAANYAAGNVAALSIGADGALTTIAGSPFGAVTSPRGVSIAPDGTSLIVSRNQNPGGLAAFTVGAGGALAAKTGSPPAAGGFPRYSTIEPSGRFLYLANGLGGAGGQTVSGYALAGEAVPTPIGTFPGGGINMAAIASSPDGRFVYVGHNGGGGSIIGYAIGAGGTLTELPTSPYDLGHGSTQGLALSPDGRFLFAGSQTSTVSVGALATDGSLTPVGSPTNVGASATQVTELAVSPDGRLLFTGNVGGSGSLSVLRISATGGLAAAPGSPLPLLGTPDGVAVTPDGRRVYASTLLAGNHVTGFAVATDGTLTPLPGSPYGTGGSNAGSSSGQSLAIAPDQGPRASFTAKAKSRTSRAVAFDGAGSTDPDGKVAIYEWEFGDGKIATSTTPKVEHAYTKDGKYQAKLRVVDDEGCSAKLIYTGQATLCNGGAAAVATVAVTVNTPPVVTIQSVRKRLVEGKLAGLTVRFRMSEAGTARVAIERKSDGRKVGRRCVKPKRSNRSKPRCARYVTVLSRSVKVKRAGRGVVSKIGKRAVKRLEPGTYRVAVKGRDTTGKWSAKRAYKKFRVAPPK
jgi:6-phosphogluconolactonase (cycloisomerase 2 family)